MQHRLTEEETERWKLGHADERTFWLQLTEAEFDAHERGYRALALQIEQAVQMSGLRDDFRALQVGCAVEDAIFYLTKGERFAADPLAAFYKSEFERSRNPGVDYRQALGEELPFGDDFFDLVILQNLLDHVANVDVVLAQVTRVLRKPNLLYFGTDVYVQEAAESRWKRQASGEIFDPEHPHTFTIETLEAKLIEHGFQIEARLPPQPSGKGDDSFRHCLFATQP